MLTDEDIDSIVQNIGDEDAKQDPIAKPSPIDEFQKHVEESLLFLDHGKDTNVENKNKTMSTDKLNKMETTVSDDYNKMVDLDKNKIMHHLHDSLTHVQLVQSTHDENPTPEYKNNEHPEKTHENSGLKLKHSESDLCVGKQEANAKDADKPNKKETKLVDSDKNLAENAKKNNECENTKLTADITPTVEEIPEKMEKDLGTELIKSFVENDVKSKNATVPSEEIVQESFLAKVNQIEPSENERHDHMEAHSLKNAGVDNTDTELTDTSKQSAEKTLVSEIKSKNSTSPVKDVPGNRESLAQDSLLTEATHNTIVDKQYSKNAVKQIERSASVAHIEVASEEQTEFPPAKRATVEPIWTINFIDEDQPNVSQQNMQESESDDLMKGNEQYIISGTRYEELENWLRCKTRSTDREKLLKLIKKSKLNKGVLKLTHLSKTIGLDELYELLVRRLQYIDEEIVKKIAHIHLARSDESMITAYVKWKKEDMLLAVKAYHLLDNNRLPLVCFDDRSVIDWDHDDRPIIVSQIVTSDGQVVPPYIYNDNVNGNASFSGPRLPPPEPFTTGEVDPFDLITFGLSRPFMSYYKLGPKLPFAVIASNLSKERSLDSLLNMFSAAGTIKAYFFDNYGSHTASLQIEYDHPLESVQAISMFHHQVLDGRVMYLNRTCKLKKWFRKSGFQKLGTALGPNRTILRNARYSIELHKLRSTTAMEIKRLKMEMCGLHKKLVAAMSKQKENQNIELENKQNASTTQQDNVNVLTTAIASSLQSNLMGLLGNKPNQQNILPQNQITPKAVKSSALTNESRTQAGNISTDSQKEAVYVIQNIPLLDMQTAYHSALNMQQQAQGFIYPQDQYAGAYAYMQGIQYGYPMTTNTNQPGNSNMQPATSSMQPATLNIQSKPTNQTSNKSKVPRTTAMEPVKPATRFDIPSPIQSQRPSAANLPIATKKPANRIEVAQTNLLSQKVEPATKSLEIPLTQTQALVKTAFKNVIPIQPIAVQAKPASIKINIPSLHPACNQSAKKRTLDINNIGALSEFPTKLPVYELQKEEAWITKQIKAMRRNSKSPNKIGNSEIMSTTPYRKGIYPDTFGPPAKKIRTSPESILRSPEIITKVKQKSPKRFRRSPERSRKSSESFRKSPVRFKKSPERIIESPERSRKSPERFRKSPKKFRKSPVRYSKSPERTRKSPERTRKSPDRFRKSPVGYSKSPERSRKSPDRFRKSVRYSISSERSRKSTERFRKSPKKFRKSPDRFSKSPERFRKSPKRSRRLATDDSWDIEPPRTPSTSRKSPLTAAYEQPKDRSRSRERDSSNSKDRYRSKASFGKERVPERDNIMTTKVYFTCLPASVTTEDLHEKMSEIGKVLFAHAYGDSGQGVVEFRHRRDAEACIEMYNLAKVDGKTIEARWFK